MALKVNITTGAWYGDNELTLNFPDDWDVSIYESKNVKELDESDIERTFLEPIGTNNIKQLAHGKKNAVIIVDDLSRPTPAYLVIPKILNELIEGGIREESICFVIGGGSHRPLNREEMAKKLSDAIVSKYRIYNHNFFSKTLDNLGHLDDGTPMYINKIVTHSDLKLAICGIIPHDSVGFGGGCKIILPGVAGYDTIAHNHSKYRGRGRGNVERQGETKDMRDNVEEVARYVGLDFTVNMVLTKKRKIAGLFMGDAVESYHQGAIFAKDVYDTVIVKDDAEATDIVVVNAYPQDSDPAQMGKSMWPFGVFKNAQKVVINQASDGINYHGLGHKMDYDSFLKMKANEPEPNNIPENAEIKSKADFVLLSSNFPKCDFYRHYPNGALFDNWNDLITQLKQLYHKPRVAVIPYSPIQLPHIIT